MANSADRGTARLYDGSYSHIEPVRAKFADNGVIKYVTLEVQSRAFFLQGNMVEQLYEQWKLKLGAFGPSEKKVQSPDYQDGISGWCVAQDGDAEFNRPVLHDVKLTTRQLETLHLFLKRRA